MQHAVFAIYLLFHHEIHQFFRHDDGFDNFGAVYFRAGHITRLGGYYFDLYFNPTNTSESTISAIEYAASNAQYGEVMSAKYPMNIAAPE